MSRSSKSISPDNPGSPVSFILFGDGEWAALALSRLIADGHSAVAVVLRSAPSNELLSTAAKDKGIRILQPDGPSSPEFVETVARLAPDLCISFAYDRIIRKPLRQVPRLGFINCHAGALPEYRGRNVINWALINGEKRLGLTVHHIDSGIDTGDIIVQELLDIGWQDDYGSLLRRVTGGFPDLLSRAVSELASGTAERTPQDQSAGTYFPGRQPGDEWIDWADTSTDIYNFVRAITRPAPGARVRLSEREIIVWKARFEPTWPKYRAIPGAVVGLGPSGNPVVKTGDSTIELIEWEVVSGACKRIRIGDRFDLISASDAPAPTLDVQSWSGDKVGLND